MESYYYNSAFKALSVHYVSDLELHSRNIYPKSYALYELDTFNHQFSVSVQKIEMKFNPFPTE